MQDVVPCNRDRPIGDAVVTPGWRCQGAMWPKTETWSCWCGCYGCGGGGGGFFSSFFCCCFLWWWWCCFFLKITWRPWHFRWMVSEIGCFQPAKVGSLPKEFTFFQVAGFLPASLEANDEKSHKTVKFQVQARACFGICSFPTISTFGRNPNKVFGAVSFCFLVSMYAKSDKKS